MSETREEKDPKKTAAPDATHEENTLKRRLMNLVLPEGEAEDLEEVSLREAIKAIDGRWFLRQLGLMLIVLAGMLILVSLRYQTQQDLIEIDQLKDEVLDIRYRSLTRNSELTQRVRQSKIEEMLKAFGDTTLLPSVEPPYILTPYEEDLRQ